MIQCVTIYLDEYVLYYTCVFYGFNRLCTIKPRHDYTKYKGNKMIYDLQKADIWKRASAALFDFIILGICAVGFIFLLMQIVGFDSYSDQLTARQEFFETKHGVDFDYEAETDENGNIKELTEEQKNLLEVAYEDFASDAEANYLITMIFQLTIITVSIGILLAFMILEFVVPMLLKNGQTLGKKIFGVAVMRLDHVRINGTFLFARNILGKYTIETMIPIMMLILMFFGTVGFMGPVIILLVLGSNIIMMIASHTNSPIHDMLAHTVTVDLSSQMIFETPEAVLEYKQKVHAEAVDKAQY